MVRKEITEKQPLGEAKKVSIMLWDSMLARQGIVAYLPIIVAVILLFVGASWKSSLVRAAVGCYACSALPFWRGGSGLILPPPLAPCVFLPAATFTLPAFHA